MTSPSRAEESVWFWMYPSMSPALRSTAPRSDSDTFRSWLSMWMISGLDVLPFGVVRLPVVAVRRQLRQMHQPLHPVLDLHEDPEVGLVHNRTLDHLAQEEAAVHRVPGVLGQLLHPEAEALVLLVDGQHAGLDIVALLVLLRRVPDPLAPRQVRDVNQPVDPSSIPTKMPKSVMLRILPLRIRAPMGYFSSSSVPGVRLESASYRG